MMKEAIRALETGPLAEIGVVAFAIAFVLVVLSKNERDRAKHLPLDDYEEQAIQPNGQS